MKIKIDKNNFWLLETSVILSTLVFFFALRACYFLLEINPLLLLFGFSCLSVWEHAKVLTFCFLFSSFLEFCIIRTDIWKYFFAKILSCYSIVIFSLLMFNLCLPIRNFSEIIIFFIFSLFVTIISVYIFSKLVFCKINISVLKFVTIILAFALFYALIFLGIAP